MPRTGVVPADARVVQRCAASTSAQTTNSPGSRGHSSERPIRQDSSMHLSVNDMGGTGPRKTPGAAAKDSCQSTFQPQHPGCSSSPSLDPPITRETLSELDWDRLSNNLLLRHDLNFETNIQYRPNTYGARGLERSLQTAQYWDAVTVEVDISLANKRRKCSYHSQRCLRTPPPSSKPLRSCHKILLRLPRMFRAIRETLKTLVPEKEWQAIDSRLDVELLVQQMQYGACDFTSLGDCLANLLRRFCSPDRDHLFDDLTAGIRQGVIQADAQLIVTSLRCAFSILEIMRLVS